MEQTFKVLEMYQKISEEALKIAKEKYNMNFNSLPDHKKIEVKEIAYKKTLEEILK